MSIFGGYVSSLYSILHFGWLCFSTIHKTIGPARQRSRFHNSSANSGPVLSLMLQKEHLIRTLAVNLSALVPQCWLSEQNDACPMLVSSVDPAVYWLSILPKWVIKNKELSDFISILKSVFKVLNVSSILRLFSILHRMQTNLYTLLNL